MSTAGPRVLVVFGSRHGATAEIAEGLARSLVASPAGRSAGLVAVARAAEHLPDPAAYDAVLVGSAVYAGRWVEPVRHYVAVYAGALRARPVWLFSSGPIGEPPFPPDDPYDAAPMAAVIGARAHRVFPGRLDKSRLSVGERAMVTAMRAPLGDFRDWAEIAAWAAQVAEALTAAPVPAEPG
jgi:menaquinone-dependent protoporphyrinogen oxidase